MKLANQGRRRGEDMIACSDCDSGTPLAPGSDLLAHVRYVWVGEPRPDKSSGRISWPWKYKDLIPCAKRLAALHADGAR